MVLLLLTSSTTAVETENADPYSIKNQWFTFRLISRSPEQMAAFYEGRGFSPVAIARIKKACFFTAVMRNHGAEVVWLELSRWKFQTEFGPVQRINRQQWQTYWNQDKVPLAQQATFGWTLFPETRNLQPSEPVGGNITLPLMDEPFTFSAEFHLGDQRKSGNIRITLENVQCKKT